MAIWDKKSQQLIGSIEFTMEDLDRAIENSRIKPLEIYCTPAMAKEIAEFWKELIAIRNT